MTLNDGKNIKTEKLKEMDWC